MLARQLLGNVFEFSIVQLTSGLRTTTTNMVTWRGWTFRLTMKAAFGRGTASKSEAAPWRRLTSRTKAASGANRRWAFSFAAAVCLRTGFVRERLSRHLKRSRFKPRLISLVPAFELIPSTLGSSNSNDFDVFSEDGDDWGFFERDDAENDAFERRYAGEDALAAKADDEADSVTERVVITYVDIAIGVLVAVLAADKADRCPYLGFLYLRVFQMTERYHAAGPDMLVFLAFVAYVLYKAPYVGGMKEVAWLMLTALNGLVFSMALAGRLVVDAVVTTVFMVGALSDAAWNSPPDAFLPYGDQLRPWWIGWVVCTLAMLLQPARSTRRAALACVCFPLGVIVHCAYVLYDTQKLARDAGALDEDYDAVNHAMRLYADAVTLFLILVDFYNVGYWL